MPALGLRARARARGSARYAASKKKSQVRTALLASGSQVPSNERAQARELRSHSSDRSPRRQFKIENWELRIFAELKTQKPPTAAAVVQGSSEGGVYEPLAGGGASPRPKGASNSKLKTQNSKLLSVVPSTKHGSGRPSVGISVVANGLIDANGAAQCRLRGFK
jgi:hypothetical protein